MYLQFACYKQSVKNVFFIYQEIKEARHCCKTVKKAS